MNPVRQSVGFGGGCHWCTEAVFQSLRGVRDVRQGYIRSDAPDDSFSEAALVTFDPDIMDLETLVEVHLRTHASTSAHKMRGKYRSAVYVFDPRQRQLTKTVLLGLQAAFSAPLVTRVLAHAEFRASDERFHNYYASDPNRPFCTRYIDPKLDFIRGNFSIHVGVCEERGNL